MNKKTTRIISSALGLVLASGIVLPVAGCGGNSGNGGKKNRDSIVIMSEELSGLFNPFYATAGADMDVVGMTQLGMLATDENGKPVVGKDEATAVLDYKTEVIGENEKTIYTFVMKNGLKFSDGKPLTMNDVMFNIYEYLDPVYTGSSTMYSIDIVGLTEYRTQTKLSDTTGEMEKINEDASGRAESRIQELIDVYESVTTTTDTYYADEAEMKDRIANHFVTPGYQSAVADKKEQASLTDEDYRKMLLADYEFALKTFKEELEADYLAAKEAFDLNSAPYKDWKEEFSNEVFCFLYYEGKITPEYEKNADNSDNKAKIVKFNYQIDPKNESYDTKEEAIERVYRDTINEELNKVLKYWGTSTTLLTAYQAEAKDIILHDRISDGMQVENISGVKSLGHTSDVAKVIVNDVEYTVAHDHNADGTPVKSDEYDVLEITINGIDPKAIYSFGFAVAPVHYYSADDKNPNGRTVDIANNEFGVEYASSDFQTNVIQSPQHVEVPVGAGTHVATDENNSDNPSGRDFWSSNIVYYKANKHFMFPIKTEKLRMQVVGASNAIDKLVSGEVDFVTPQFTKQNNERLASLKAKGYESLDAWQLGYGYIGINAGKVPDINIRRAIMSAMNTNLSLEYYAASTAKTIKWPMSMESWAYPFEPGSKTEKNPTTEATRLLNELEAESVNTNNLTSDLKYLKWTGAADAETKVKEYMKAAGVQAGSKDLKLQFTIAGASITEHPTYEVFKQAAEILNKCGWEVEVTPDSQALTKLATGSLAVWAAAWGSSVDPDMYQVYHKDSTATSVYAWGYREIKNGRKAKYKAEWDIIEKLSEKIDEGRETLDDTARKNIYTDALVYVLELAVEMPVYQRKTLYAYNSNSIKGLTTKVNPYTSPLEEIWNVELVK